eukprot:4087368-Pyramimonas_sp.AAC.1
MWPRAATGVAARPPPFLELTLLRAQRLRPPPPLVLSKTPCRVTTKTPCRGRTTRPSASLSREVPSRPFAL